MFQKKFVDQLRWCTYVVFTELLMLGQCMPGGCARRAAAGRLGCGSGGGTSKCLGAAGSVAPGLRRQWLAGREPGGRWEVGAAALPALVQALIGQSSSAALVAPAAGPTSTQMGFALGVLKKGLSGGLLSGALFQVRHGMLLPPCAWPSVPAPLAPAGLPH